MKKHWWKLLAVAILIYTFIAGMLVPLRPGIISVSPSSMVTGQETSLKVIGYNTHFKQAENSLQVWLKLSDDHFLPANNMLIHSDQLMHVRFRIPDFLPTADEVKDMALIVDNELDGASVLPSAVFVTQRNADPAQGQRLWMQGSPEEFHSLERMSYPFRNILNETIRNTYFHVPMWFAMILLFAVSLYYSSRYLSGSQEADDRKVVAFTKVGILFGILGLVTGAIWAKFTWGRYWSFDVKQNMSAIAMLIYLAYFVLRRSFDDPEKQARISAVYNIFAFAAMIPLLFVIPRLTDSLHPGNGGNPGMGGEDLDNTMRMVFYPAIIGWTLFGIWLSNLSYRLQNIRDYWMEKTN